MPNDQMLLVSETGVAKQLAVSKAPPQKRRSEPCDGARQGQGLMTRLYEKATPPRESETLPFFRWRKINRVQESEITVGPSLAWLVFALAALCVKQLGAASVLQAVWRSLPW